jgi:VWFA-related protein
VALNVPHVALALALAAGAAVIAGESDGSAVRLTAVVTNARGQLVGGLRAADFQVIVDGAPRPVDALEFNDGGAKTRRVVALLLDEFHVDASNSAAVRDALLPFVDLHLRSGDRAVVFKPLDSLTTIQLTDDIGAIRRAIGTFEGRKGEYAPRTVFEQSYMAQAPDAVVSARAQIVSSALRAVAAHLGEMPGVRPAIVLVSDGFARQRADRNLPANLLSAVRVANRGDVPVYVFAPSVVAAGAGAPADSVDPAHAALQAIAAQTGGDLTAGVASFADGLARMVRDLDAHYVLTYQPPHGDDGRFHSVEISLKRPGTRIRARAGYVAPLSAELRARATPPPVMTTRMLRRSGLIQTWSGVTKGSEGKPRVMFTWEPAPPRAGGAARPRPAILVVTAATPAGAVLFDGSIGAVGAVLPNGTANRAVFDAPAGRVHIDVRILDAKGVVLDDDARDLDVPDFQGARATILPPAVLRTGSAREFRAVAGDPDAAPVPSREFRRTERLLLRVPAYAAGGGPAHVSATLLNRWRQPIRAVPATDASPSDGVTQFDVPLAPLAPGEYTIRLTAGGVTEHVTFRVRG